VLQNCSRSVRDVLADRERVEEGRALEEIRDAPAERDELAVVHLGDVAPAEEDLSGVRGDETDEHLQENALADVPSRR